MREVWQRVWGECGSVGGGEGKGMGGVGKVRGDGV